MSKAFQGIWGCQYFSFSTTAVAFLLGWASNLDASQRSNASGFVLTPAQMQAETTYTVQRMLFVGGTKYCYCLLISCLERLRLLVVTAAGEPQSGYEVLLPSWVDLVQNG